MIGGTVIVIDRRSKESQLSEDPEYGWSFLVFSRSSSKRILSKFAEPMYRKGCSISPLLTFKNGAEARRWNRFIFFIYSNNRVSLPEFVKITAVIIIEIEIMLKDLHLIRKN